MFSIEQEEVLQMLHDQELLLKIYMLTGSDLEDPEFIVAVSSLLEHRS